jgi:hypothetical protein
LTTGKRQSSLAAKGKTFAHIIAHDVSEEYMMKKRL